LQQAKDSKGLTELYLWDVLIVFLVVIVQILSSQLAWVQKFSFLLDGDTLARGKLNEAEPVENPKTEDDHTQRNERVTHICDVVFRYCQEQLLADDVTD
jgi:hypothetical protein